MAFYEWNCYVKGVDKGVVTAKSENDAREKAKKEVENTGMNVVGEINIVRARKIAEQKYKNTE